MNLGRWLGLFITLLLLVVVWQLRVLVLLCFIAIVLATALNRGVRAQHKLGMNRAIAILLTVGGILMILAGFTATIVIPLSSQIDELMELLPLGIQRLQEFISSLQALIPGRLLREFLDSANLAEQSQTAANWAINSLYQLFSHSLTLVFNAFFVLVVTLMLLADPQRYRDALIQLFPAFYRQRADTILAFCEQDLIGYLIGFALSTTFIGISCTLGLIVLQVPLPLVNGLLAALFSFIPYVGGIASVIPPMLLALLNEPWKAGAVIVVYFVIQQVEGNLVTPAIMKQQVSLLPAITLPLLTALGVFFGILGLFAGLPIIVVAQVWLREALIKDVLDQWQTSELKTFELLQERKY